MHGVRRGACGAARLQGARQGRDRLVAAALDVVDPHALRKRGRRGFGHRVRIQGNAAEGQELELGRRIKVVGFAGEAHRRHRIMLFFFAVNELRIVYSYSINNYNFFASFQSLLCFKFNSF